MVKRIGCKEEEGQLEKCFAVKEGVEPDQGSVAHEGVSECLDIEILKLKKGFDDGCKEGGVDGDEVHEHGSWDM